VEILNLQFKVYQEVPLQKQEENQNQLLMIQEDKPTWQTSVEEN
jgi:hypothetical protein